MRAVLAFGLIGALLSVLPFFLGFRSADLAVLGVFSCCFLLLIFSASLAEFSVGPRAIVALFALRPILDATQSQDSQPANLPLQNLFALTVAVLLIAMCYKRRPESLTKSSNGFVIALLASTAAAWMWGGLSAGANGFLRTEWGLLLALLLGPLFTSKREIDLFLRVLFYSSVLVLIILAFNLSQGEYIGDVWRITGQFGVANTLAAVSFSLFLLGLYTFEKAMNGSEKSLCILLLALLAVAILLSQSRTIAGLLLISIFVWLWGQGRRKAVYYLAFSLVIVTSLIIIGNSLLNHWRFTSSLLLDHGELSEDVVNLTGRTYLWAKTFEQFAGASSFHKLFGMGWGTVFANFETFGYELSSVTENSFLWFLVGSGVFGLIAFSGYLASVLSKSWRGWHKGADGFDRTLALLTFLVGLTFLIEGFTTDLVLSPLASGYLYCVCSIFIYRAISRQKEVSLVTRD